MSGNPRYAQTEGVPYEEPSIEGDEDLDVDLPSQGKPVGRRKIRVRGADVTPPLRNTAPDVPDVKA
jgi:hypothetical protein